MPIKKDLLSILICPKCRRKLKKESAFLICEKCSLAYPVIGDIPNMLIDEAWPLSKAKNSGFSHNLKL